MNNIWESSKLVSLIKLPKTSKKILHKYLFQNVMKIFQMGIHSLNTAHLKDKTPQFKTSLKKDFVLLKRTHYQNYASAICQHRRHENSCVITPALSCPKAQVPGLRAQRGLLPGELANPCCSTGKLWLLLQGELMHHATGFALMLAAGEMSQD